MTWEKDLILCDSSVMTTTQLLNSMLWRTWSALTDRHEKFLFVFLYKSIHLPGWSNFSFQLINSSKINFLLKLKNELKFFYRRLRLLFLISNAIQILYTYSLYHFLHHLKMLIRSFCWKAFLFCSQPLVVNQSFQCKYFAPC